MEEKVKHLEFIQSIISRMAANSFQIKSIFVTIVVAVIALSIKEAYSYMYLALLLPTTAFWILDAYYLYQEKLYRELYNSVRKAEKIDFCMDVSCYKEFKKFIKCIICNGSTIGFYSPFAALFIFLFCLASIQIGGVFSGA